MSSNIQYARMFQKRDKTENWTESNFKPGPGEIIVYEKDENINRPRIRIGAENTNLSDLPFLTGEVYSQKEQPPIDAAEGAIWINEDAPLNELLTNAGAGKNMAVNITVDQNQLKADKTFYDIKTSLEIGYFIYAIITFKSNGQTLYQKYATLSNYKADQYIEFTTWLPGKGATKVVQLKYRYGDEATGEILPEIPELGDYYAFIARTENGEIELYYTTGEVAKNIDDTLYMFARENLKYIHYILLNDTWEKVQASACEAGNPLSETVLTPFWTNHQIYQTGDTPLFVPTKVTLQPEESDDIIFTTENQSVSCKILTNDKLELIYSNGGGGGANWNANEEKEDGYVYNRPIWHERGSYNLELTNEVDGKTQFFITDFVPDYNYMSSIAFTVRKKVGEDEEEIGYTNMGYFKTEEVLNAKIAELQTSGDIENKMFIVNGILYNYLSDCYLFLNINKEILGFVVSETQAKMSGTEGFDKGIYFSKIETTQEIDGVETEVSFTLTKMKFDYEEIKIDENYTSCFKNKKASNVYSLDLSGITTTDAVQLVQIVIQELNRFEAGDVVLIPSGYMPQGG